MASGLVGRDDTGRRLLIALVIAFVPAAVVGVALESAIKDNLFGVGPVIAAWIVGGIVILFAARYFSQRPPGTIPLESMTVARRDPDRCRADHRALARYEPQPRDDPRRACARVHDAGRAGVQLPARARHADGRHRVRDAEARRGAHRHVRLAQPADRLRRRVHLGRHRGALAGRLPEPARPRALRLVPPRDRGIAIVPRALGGSDPRRLHRRSAESP